MLEDFFTTHEIYQEGDGRDYSSPPSDDDLSLKGQVEGFLQGRAGGFPSANQAKTALSTHVFYCELGADVAEGDYILHGSKYYLVDYVPPEDGVSGVEHHLELAVTLQNDIRG